MNTLQLQYFITTARLQNISKAAERLHISQSALSKQIAKLETELGYPLFDRNGKKIQLNSAGKRFLTSGDRILQELISAQNDIALIQSSHDRRIRIGAACITNEFLSCMSAFSVMNPETEFLLNTRIEYDEHLNINDFDALICPDELQYERLSGFSFYTEKYFFAVNKDYLSEKETVFQEAMLLHHPIVFLQGNSILPELPYRIYSSAGNRLPHVYFTDTRESHFRMIALGAANGFVPASEADIYKSSRQITLLHVMDKRLSRPIKICFLREKHLSPLAAAFRQFTIDYLHLK